MIPDKSNEIVPEVMDDADLPEKRVAWVMEEIDEHTVQATYVGHHTKSACERERTGDSK